MRLEENAVSEIFHAKLGFWAERVGCGDTRVNVSRISRIYQRISGACLHFQANCLQ